MRAMPIEWHEACLKNQSEHLGRLRLRLDDMRSVVEALYSATQHYALQITEAKRQGKTKFDAERFLRKVAQ